MARRWIASTIEDQRLRRYAAFVLSGSIAFLVNAVVLEMLIRLAGLGPIVAQSIAIAVAMLVSWMLQRTFTFKVSEPPSLAEFGRFVAVAWSASAVNYAVFAAVLLLAPGTMPLLALAIASLAALLVAYTGMSRAVFTRGTWKDEPSSSNKEDVSPQK